MVFQPLPVGFIVDGPWLTNCYEIRILDYFSSDELRLRADLAAIEAFPDAMFLPGFWSVYGMCTEPSTFGVRCTIPANQFPLAHTLLRSADDLDRLPTPRAESPHRTCRRSV
jgi:uroporphyrinogen decarboxylase